MRIVRWCWGPAPMTAANKLPHPESTRDRWSRAKGPGGPGQIGPVRLVRLLRVLALLEDDSCTEPQSMHIALGISRRTLFRDLAMLKSVGLSFIFDRVERRYQRTSLEFKFGHTLTKSEIESIRHWLGTVVNTLPSDGEPLATAIRKLYAIIIAETGNIPDLPKSKSKSESKS